jgi:hypothetical protein
VAALTAHGNSSGNDAEEAAIEQVGVHACVRACVCLCVCVCAFCECLHLISLDPFILLVLPLLPLPQHFSIHS